MHNFRDVGGYPVAGGTTRWGVLYRAGTLHGISEATRAQLTGLGIRTVVDLRETVEAGDAPAPHHAGTFARVSNPIFRQRDIVGTVTDLEPLYLQILEQCAPEIVSAIGLLASPETLPAVVHCSAGKDRTGLVIGLTLSAIGAADEVVAQDYGLTEEFLTGELRTHIAAKSEQLGISTQKLVTLMGSPPRVLQATLDALRGRFGGAEGYLLAHGLRPESLDVLREALIERDAD
ncbi:tyrosine-protein phosphatase [Sporichthya polymorpha]|uniref:tyrosine-protein phosphatase n=1 Tax=Sporichthya polymorpha TaxID=35751 RepID=UPI00036A0DD2